MLQWIESLGFGQVVALAIGINGSMVILAAMLDRLADRRFGDRRVMARRPPDRSEWAWAVLTTAINIVMSLVGFELWRRGTIQFSDVPLWLDALHLIGFVLFMDLAMFVGHRLAHLRLLYPLVHRFHHRWQEPNAITFFALHPLEILGFGLFWLVALIAVDVSWAAAVGFVVVNVTFGLSGHIGIDPLPDRVRRWPLFNLVATPTFHVHHHADPDTNYGFYLVIWDRLTGSVNPEYRAGRIGGST